MGRRGLTQKETLSHPHILWNFRLGDEKVNYYLVVADYVKGIREGTKDSILAQVAMCGTIEEYRERLEGGIPETRLKYLLVSFSANVDPNEIKFSKTGKIFVRDSKLYERERDSEGLEKYVEDLYS